MEPPFDISNLIEQMYKEIKSLEVTVNQGIPDMQTEECAINLWNWGVTKKSEDSITKMEQAMVRHISCRLGYWCQGLEPSEEIVERNILMAMKTGKGWIDAGTPETGTEFLEIALNNLEKFYSMMTQRSTQETDVNLHKAHVERDIFKVLTYQVEAAVYLENFELASHLIQRCKDMLQRQPNKASYLSILCYNFGVEMYEKKFFDQSSFWLSQSYEIGKTDKRYNTGHEMQAKVLRLLATVYLEWDCRIHNDKALNAIRLANEEHLHPSGLFLKMKILLHCSLPDDVISMAAVEMLCHELSLDIYLNTVKLLMKHNRDSVGFDFLKMVCNHFEQSPDIGKALLLQIELLLKRGKEFLARQKVEDLITGHYTGKQLPVDMLNHLHLILWDCATKSFEFKNYSEALQWYNYSLSFYAANHNDPNLAKLQRNRASCFLYLNEPLKAKEAVIAAEKCEKGSIFTQFISYKIAIKENDDLEATNAISAMGNMADQTDMEMLLEENCSAIDLLSLAAQIALDHLHRVAGTQEQKPYCRPWTQKVTAWNLAVQTEDSPLMMKDCFLLSYKISLHCPCDRTVLVAQKSCLLMAASVDLEMARNTTCHSEQVQLLTKSLENIKLCREVWIILQSTGTVFYNPTEIILLLFEFEVRAKLNDPGLETVLESVWNLSILDTKTLESIASLSMEVPAYYPSICKKVLLAALNLHKKQDSLNVYRISKCLHSLIKLTLPERSVELENCDKEEAWRYYQEALTIISTYENYPGAEILWLMTHAWNTGIYQYGEGKYSDAARWCSLALSFLSYLGSLKGSYESKTNGLCERFNGTLKQMLKTFAESHRNREKYLPHLLFAYREVPQASTGFSPFELLFRRKVWGPLDLVREHWEGNTDEGGVPVVQYVLEFRDRLRALTESVRESLRAAQECQRKWYDRGARDRVLDIGQKALALRPGKKDKLQAAWQGPFKVVERISDTTYIVSKCSDERLTKAFHVNMLKPYFERPEDFKVMPFEMKNAPATFQRMADRLLEGFQDFACAYLDDIAIYSRTWEDHLGHVSRVLKRIHLAGLTLKPDKCHVGMAEVQYLGHRVGSGRQRPEPAKVEAIANWPQPRTKTHVLAFLGTAGYYRIFVPEYSALAKPLTDLTKKAVPKQVTWTPEYPDAFQRLKAALIEAPVLAAPNHTKLFLVHADASMFGLGAVLSQVGGDGMEHPVVYLSRKLLPREVSYATVEKSALP
ncbi:testis-expressed protein 11 [Bufo bufo]|uniref:testis-expressed protein 11 n=1 Tax=Bufo bufo TaxID=8384 RepID=UPI001ABEA393|nr:testis-expressed protein 11 [Bufo bufo]